MARDRANIRTDMWGDSDWRKLSSGAQWLYMYLLTSPSLSYVGTADWRPGRIAAKVSDFDAGTVRDFAYELEMGRFVFTDDDTEEALVRSFMRHDGLLLNPNLWRSMGNDFADVGSEALRGIIASEARRLRDENPIGFETSKGTMVDPWASKHLSTMLSTPCPTEGRGTPSDTPCREVVVGAPPTTTSTSTATPSLTEGGPPPRKCRKHSHWEHDEDCGKCAQDRRAFEEWESTKSVLLEDAGPRRVCEHGFVPTECPECEVTL